VAEAKRNSAKLNISAKKKQQDPNGIKMELLIEQSANMEVGESLVVSHVCWLPLIQSRNRQTSASETGCNFEWAISKACATVNRFLTP
jgi:hypothetical protein